MIKLYNTLSRKKEIFKPLKDKKVNLFVCGPTVYDFPHIGHARTYVAFDMISKYLREKGYDVFYLQNITDIDDKIIIRAKEKKTTAKKLALLFEKEYLKDMKTLKVNSITKYAKATDHIKEIIDQAKRLLSKGFAYQAKEGIYYDIAKFKNYGKLARRTVLQAEDGVCRIDLVKGKRNKGDFCLWKFSKPEEPKWKSPWGYGRPGWHIEDTAIAEKYFGPQYDIHGGARDLIFPHHEAEIAQMEAVSGKSPMVKYWLHSGFLTVKGEKMAKSLGNFITIRNFLKNHPYRVLRLFVLKNHYRSPINYSEKLIRQTEKELERIEEFMNKIKISNFQVPAKQTQTKSKFQISKYERNFEKAMEDDFNTAKAIAVIFELIKKGNSLIAENSLDRTEAKEILEFLKKVDKIFNFIFEAKKKEKIPGEVLKLANEREKYRQEKNWKKADEIRKKIEKLGYWIEDTKKGVKIRFSAFSEKP